MSDEIDIEEHDVMDNPKIKRIFPDLSVVKKEINQYYDEVINTPSETAPLEDSCQSDAITQDSETQLSNHIQNNNEVFDISPLHSTEATETQKASRYLYENIIILGSKPNLECQENCLTKEPKIILKDVNSFLNRCKRYCKECFILFPKAHLFNIHVTDIHIKDNDEMVYMGRQIKDKLFKCNVCNQFLSSPRNLFRHFRNFHEDIKTLKTIDRSSRKISANKTSQIKATVGLSCFHCQQLFSTQSSLIEHLYEVLEPNKIGLSDKSTSSTNLKESKVNINDRFIEEKCVKQLKELNLSNENKVVANSHFLSHSKADINNCDAESILPRNNNPRSRSLDSVVKFTECGDGIVRKEKRKANSDLLYNEDTNASKKQKIRECNVKNKLKYDIAAKHVEVSNNKKESQLKTGKETGNFKSSEKPLNSTFYKCYICSKYNVTFEFYSRHIMNDHNIKEVTEVEKVPFDSQCKYCPSKPSGINSYNVHLFKYHKNQLKEVYKPPEEQLINKNHENVGNKIQCALKSILFKCMKCDLYFLSSKAALDHSKHSNILETWKCSVCLRLFERKNMALHEKQHSYSQTFTVHTLTESNSWVLYKCSNCTIHYNEENFFLHYLKCDSETPNSLYCKLCDILINRDDMVCHGINHNEKKMQCSDFIIIDSDIIDDRHVSSKPANKKTDECDIHDRHVSPNTNKQIKNKSDMKHERYTIPKTARKEKSIMIHDRHKSPNATINKTDKSDMIHYRNINSKTSKTKNSSKYYRSRLSKQSFEEYSKFAMSFCPTCKCFIGNLNLRKLHVQGKCGHMLGYVCKYCGLMLTTKTHATHKEYHKKQKISLHDYTFYDLKTEKRICPPIPDYPKCNSCGVHFLRNCDIKIHSCQEQEYKTCNLCSIKLIEDAYKLHIHFHSYSIPGVNNTELEDSAPHANPTNEISNVEPSLSALDHSNIIDAMIFYTCKSCQLTVNTYDKVVEHCQDHYDSEVVRLNVQKCQNCSLILQISDCENHYMMHLNGKYNENLIKVIDFDPFYFRYNNAFWTKHIFAYVADNDITKILRNSIYKYECRLKMHNIPSVSSDSVLYRCDKCQLIVDPPYLYTHAVNSVGRSCVKLRKHPCALCGLCFLSLAFRIAHEKEHESIDMNLKAYKIILYNKEEHAAYIKTMYEASNRYILYQCRNCERVVDKFQRNSHKCNENSLKICATCGLLFDKEDFDLHFIRHEELDKFDVENITVVMFGKLELPYHGQKKLRSTFSGTKYDYTLHKCKNCDVCLSKKSTSEHVCVFDNSKCKCSKCGLYFTKLDLKCHYKIHESNLDFNDLNMNIIIFDTTSANVDAKDTFEEKNYLVKQTKEVIENTSCNLEKREIMYKCDCGLHFLEEPNAQQHANICNARMKISKQSCIKCDLLFTPGELFNHLLKHHCDKKLQFKFDIVLVRKKKKN